MALTKASGAPKSAGFIAWPSVLSPVTAVTSPASESGTDRSATGACACFPLTR